MSEVVDCVNKGAACVYMTGGSACLNCGKEKPLINVEEFGRAMRELGEALVASLQPLVDFINTCDKEELMNTLCGPQGGYLASEPPKQPKRMAWVAVSRELFEQRCGDWQNYDQVRIALMLPANAKIVAMSTHYRFDYDQVAVKVECPDFRTVEEGCCMPQVEATYYCTEDLLGKTTTHFDGWENQTTVVGDYNKPKRVSLDRCSEELGHFAMPEWGICYCGQVVYDPMALKWVHRFKDLLASRMFGGVEWPVPPLNPLANAQCIAEEKKPTNRGYEFL